MLVEALLIIMIAHCIIIAQQGKIGKGWWWYLSYGYLIFL